MNNIKFNISNLDRNLAIGGIVIGIVATVLLGYTALNYISLGIILPISCAIYLGIRKREESSLEITVSRFLPFSPHLLLNILFFALLSYSIILLYFSIYERPLSYFISIALMSTLVTLKIFTTREEGKGHSAFILMKILLISLSLRWSLFYIYPGSFLGTDPWRNAILYDSISQAGHLISDMGGYYHMPVKHLLVVITSQLTGLCFRDSMVVSISLFEVISLIFIFLLAKHLFNTKVGLLSTLILGINNVHIWWGWWPVAQTVGIALVALILFLILSPKRRDAVNFRVLSILILTLLLFTHSVSSFVTLVILLMSYFGYIIYNLSHNFKQKFTDVRGNIAFFFGIALLSYWMYISRSFSYFTRMALGIGPTLSVPICDAPALIAEVNPMWAEMNKLCSLLFYVLAIIGILSILNRRNMNSSRFNLAFCGITLTGIVFTVFFFGITAEVLIGRWFIFMQLLLAIPAAVGLISISNAMRTNRKKVSTLAIIIFLLTFLMITNTIASFDSPIYPSYLKNRYALTESELCSVDTIKSIYPNTIVMDAVHALALVDSPEISKKGFSLQDIQTEFTEVNGLLLLRRDIVDNVVFSSIEGLTYKNEFTYDPYQALDRNKFNHIYDTGTVGAYFR